MKKTVLLVLVPAILMAYAWFAATPILMHGWNSVVEYNPPFTSPLAAGRAGQPVTDQVVIVVVDALRDDASRAMPTLNSLRDKGASLTLRAGQPSLSIPGWSVIGTGAWQERSGVTTNWYTGTVKIDSIFAEARRSGIRTAMVGSSGWTQLYGPYLDYTREITVPADGYHNPVGVARQDDLALAEAIAALKAAQRPGLLLLHFSGPDEAGHGAGGASEVYKQVTLGIDARIASLLAQLDLSRTTLIVTADHGTIDTGGHGGWEDVVLNIPMVAVGKGIQPGKYANADQSDLAPTVAVLLGTAMPTHSQGRPLLELVSLTDKARAERGVDYAQQQAAMQSLYVQQVGGPPLDLRGMATAQDALTRGDYTAAYGAAKDFAQALAGQAGADREARLVAERLGRTPTVALILLPFLLWGIIIVRQRLPLRGPIAGAIVYFAVYNALFFERGNQFSLSAFNSEDQIKSFFTQRGMDAIIALLIAAVVAGLLTRRSGFFAGAMAGVNTMFLVALGLAIQVLYFYWLWNWEFTWYLPDLAQGMKYYLDMLQTSVFWPLLYAPAGVIVPLLSAGVAWLAGRQKPAGAAAPPAAASEAKAPAR